MKHKHLVYRLVVSGKKTARTYLTIAQALRLSPVSNHFHGNGSRQDQTY